LTICRTLKAMIAMTGVLLIAISALAESTMDDQGHGG
jgi:hypothetical protein